MARTRKPAPLSGRAYGYTRVSTDEQAASGLGLEAQRAAIEQAARRFSLQLVTVFTDDGISGASELDQRPGLFAAIAALQPGDVLIVKDRQRFAREMDLAAILEREITKNRRARIVTTETRSLEADDDASFIARKLEDLFGELERRKIQDRTRRALAAKKARGEFLGACPYGFRLAADGRTLEQHQDEQRLLSVVDDCRQAGFSFHATAGELNRRGFTTRRGTAWRSQYVRSLLLTKNRTPETSRESVTA